MIVCGLGGGIEANRQAIEFYETSSHPEIECAMYQKLSNQPRRFEDLHVVRLGSQVR